MFIRRQYGRGFNMFGRTAEKRYSLGRIDPMTSQAIPDIITIIGPFYQQPIADLVDKLLQIKSQEPHPAGTGHLENGYAASLILLLVAMLESYVSRLKYTRRSTVNHSLPIPDLLASLFPELPTVEDLREIFLLRNIVVHNHVWHLDVSEIEVKGAPTISTPKELGFNVNKNYNDIVDLQARRTHRLGLHVSPTAVDKADVKSVFSVVWLTLKAMNKISYSDTPLAGRQVAFRRRRLQFEELLIELGS